MVGWISLTIFGINITANISVMTFHSIKESVRKYKQDQAEKKMKKYLLIKKPKKPKKHQEPEERKEELLSNMTDRGRELMELQRLASVGEVQISEAERA